MTATTTVNAAPATFPKWEDLSELQQLASEYSDFHKDAYGFRPRGDVSHWTVEDFKAEFARLGATCKANAEMQAEAEARNVVEFEKVVSKLLTTGAKDRAQALRWLADAEGTGEDWEFFCYCNGLPYGYFRDTTP